MPRTATQSATTASATASATAAGETAGKAKITRSVWKSTAEQQEDFKVMADNFKALAKRFGFSVSIRALKKFEARQENADLSQGNKTKNNKVQKQLPALVEASAQLTKAIGVTVEPSDKPKRAKSINNCFQSSLKGITFNKVKMSEECGQEFEHRMQWVSYLYKNLSAEELQIFKDQAAADKVRYENEMAEWNKKHNIVVKPKKARSAYQFFAKKYREEHNKPPASEISDEWKMCKEQAKVAITRDMTPEMRNTAKKYQKIFAECEALAADDKIRYENEKAAFEEAQLEDEPEAVDTEEKVVDEVVEEEEEIVEEDEEEPAAVDTEENEVVEKEEEVIVEEVGTDDELDNEEEVVVEEYESGEEDD